MSEVTNYFGDGISYVANVLDNTVEQYLVEELGFWYRLVDTELG